MSKKKCTDGRRNNRPPQEHRFSPGQTGNPFGRPKKRKTSFADDIMEVFGKEREVTIDGEKKNINIRQLILERIGLGAAKGDPKMIKLAIPFLNIMDDAPEFEILPEDKAALNAFLEKFNDDGDAEDET